MRLFAQMARSDPRRSALAIACLALASLAEGVGVATLLPVLSLAGNAEAAPAEVAAAEPVAIPEPPTVPAPLPSEAPTDELRAYDDGLDEELVRLLAESSV